MHQEEIESAIILILYFFIYIFPGFYGCSRPPIRVPQPRIVNGVKFARVVSQGGRTWGDGTPGQNFVIYATGETSPEYWDCMAPARRFPLDSDADSIDENWR